MDALPPHLLERGKKKWMPDQLPSLLRCRHQEIFRRKLSCPNGGRPRPGRRITLKLVTSQRATTAFVQRWSYYMINKQTNTKSLAAGGACMGLLPCRPRLSRCHLCPTTNQLWNCRVVGLARDGYVHASTRSCISS